MSELNHAAFTHGGIQELSFGQVDLVGGAVDWGTVATETIKGAVIGAAAGAAGGAAGGAMVAGVGAVPGAASGAVTGGVGGAVAGALTAIYDTWND